MYTIEIKTEVEVRYLLAKVGARYWEDTEVNGVADEKGELIPCREGQFWCPIIELETGKIINWEQGKTAEVHYKSVDRNEFILLDKAQNEKVTIEGYVIDMMCPKESGWGDYVIMDIDENGFIQDWKVNLNPFSC
jgi:hypothetical protein